MIGYNECGAAKHRETGQVVHGLTKKSRLVKGVRHVWFQGHDGRGNTIRIRSEEMGQWDKAIPIGFEWLSADNYRNRIVDAVQLNGKARVTVEVEKLPSNGDPDWTQPGVGWPFEHNGVWEGIVIERDYEMQPAPEEDK